MAAKQHASRAVRSFGIAIVVTVGIVAALLLFMVLDDGGADLSYKTLDYDVQVQSNGDLKITQHIDMKLADRSDDDGDHPWKQLYQQYTLKESNLANITDISVRNATTGETYQQGDIAIPSTIAPTNGIENMRGSGISPMFRKVTAIRSRSIPQKTVLLPTIPTIVPRKSKSAGIFPPPRRRAA